MYFSRDEFVKANDQLNEIIRKNHKEDEVVVFDGIIDVDRYYNTSIRILWILKEANSNESWTYQDMFTNSNELNKNNGLAIFRRVVYTSYGILKAVDKEWKEYPWSNDSSAQDVLREIAYVNIKKVPGGNVSDDNEMRTAYLKNRELLHSQFELYNPQVVIFGNTLQYIQKEDFPGLEKAEKLQRFTKDLMAAIYGLSEPE